MELKTKRLTLKPMDLADRDMLVELLTDETVGKTYMVPDFSNRQAAEQLAERLCRLSGQEDRHMAGIYLGEVLIGLIHETETGEGWVELGYALLPRYHGFGYATEALTGTIGWLFDHGWQQVRAAAFAENLASLRVMEKSGMRATGEQEEIAYRGSVHRCLGFVVERDSGGCCSGVNDG